MIDRNNDPPPMDPHDSGIVPTSPNVSANEIFNDLFPGTPASRAVTTPVPIPSVSRPHAESTADRPRMPVSPHTLQDSGLTLMKISDLVMKQLYLHGNLLGVDIARHIRLPFQVVDESIRFLKDSKVIEVSSGDVIGTASYRFNLTELGNNRARESFDQCRYVGPAPVPLEAYVNQCGLQSVAATDCFPEELARAFADMIIKPDLLQELGPAVCSGKSIFIYGPPGNGKTMVAKGLGRFLNNRGGEIYVPYAIQAENSIITVFDPTLHETTDDEEVARYETMSTAVGGGATGGATGGEYLDDAPDLRWRRIRRPVVITGGELTLEMLDLQYNKTSAFYTAPLHIKSNGGVFLIDDFGRQILSPRDLLNRWILPLEERVDYLTLATGRKFAVPFEQLIIFSTNLDPRELVDEAFLRRIRHKIRIDSPNRELFTEIFQLACRARHIPYNPAAIDFLYLTYYDKGKPPRSSDPRDLLEIVLSICRFRRQPVVLTPEIMAEATERFFCQL